MRRMIAMVLLLSLLLSGCGGSGKEMEQPVRFYYAYANARLGPYGEESGALGWETRDLGPDRLPVEEILRLYLQGPKDTVYRSVFPEGTAVEEAVLRDHVLTVSLQEETGTLQGITKTLAEACLVKTMTQFAEIEAVLLCINGTPLRETAVTADQYLFVDDTATSDAVTMKLYFGAPDGRYLAGETRSRTFQSEEEIPRYILQQLLEGTQTEDGQNLLPEGTRILDLQVQDGVCTVNFSESFLWYQPDTHLGARRAVLSVANTLTELPEVACVRFLCGGDSVSYYMGLDLSEPIYRDVTAFGGDPDWKDAVDVTLLVPCGKQDRLATVPCVLERSSGRSLAADVVNALLEMETINSYVNPFPKGTKLLSEETKNGVCTVTFNTAFAMCDADETQAKRAVRTVVATLCELEDVEQVCIEIQNGKLTTVDLSEPLTVDPAWLLP